MNKNFILNELKYLQTFETPIIPLGLSGSNEIYIKKEECIPFSFGGNKVRIAARYFMELIDSDCDSVITYGASTSNLCRVIANMAYRYGIDCSIISPKEGYKETANSRMIKLLGAHNITTSIECVHQTIEDTIRAYRNKGYRPYFIYGGGHGKLGTDSYRVVMKQIKEWEEERAIQFDYIFITLGTGTSISGLILENKYCGINKIIVGVSIAREKKRALEILTEAISIYGEDGSNMNYEIYDYCLGGYGKYTNEVRQTVNEIFKKNGLNLDLTYTGKAFTGMNNYIKEQGIENKRILFIHTGGTPLFFDSLIN